MKFDARNEKIERKKKKLFIHKHTVWRSDIGFYGWCGREKKTNY